MAIEILRSAAETTLSSEFVGAMLWREAADRDHGVSLWGVRDEQHAGLFSCLDDDTLTDIRVSAETPDEKLRDWAEDPDALFSFGELLAYKAGLQAVAAVERRVSAQIVADADRQAEVEAGARLVEFA